MSRRPTTASPLKSPKKSMKASTADYENLIADQQHNMQMVTHVSASASGQPDWFLFLDDHFRSAAVTIFRASPVCLSRWLMGTIAPS